MMTEMNTSVQIAPRNNHGLLLNNPVIAASGTFGYGTEYADTINIQQLGAIVSKGITLQPRQGNSEPRLSETYCGILNSIGLENIGVEAVVSEKAPLWADWQVPVIVNIAGESIEEYARIAEILDEVDGVCGIEVNISCPNVAEGGMEFGTDPQIAARVTAEVKSKTQLPIILKLTPNVTDISAIAIAVEDAGADCLTIANTFKGMAIDTSTRRPILSNITGGYSGPAIKPLSLYLVYKVFQQIHIPIIGCGGIASAQDALEYIMAGAHAIQIGTATFNNPQTMHTVIEGIGEFMKREGINNLADIVGSAH